MEKKVYKSSSKRKNLSLLKTVLESSYNDRAELPKTIVKDTTLSGKRVSVYNDLETHKTYVVHRGTHSVKDWMTDFAMVLGYEGGKRFSHSKKIQERAEKRYGSENIITVGHSLGGRLAEKFGSNTSAIVTYNKAVTPRSILESLVSPIPEEQIDVRTSSDPVSFAGPLQRRLNPIVNIDSQTLNPIKVHGLEELIYDHLRES